MKKICFSCLLYVCWRVHELAQLDPSHCISHTSYDLPVSVMRLLCPITGHKEIFVQVISFGGKIAYYGLGKLEKMGSILVPAHLRLVVGCFRLCVPPVCRMARHFVWTLHLLCKPFLIFSALLFYISSWDCMAHTTTLLVVCPRLHKYCHFFPVYFW